MLWDCPEEPGVRAVLRGGEVPRGRETDFDICVSDEEFAELCEKRKNSPREGVD